MRHRNGSHRDGIVVVGGGLAGQRCVEGLRHRGYDGALRLVCAEPHRPYDRPPLSKHLLAGAGEATAPAYRPLEWYEQQAVDLVLDVRATELDTRSRRVALSDGNTLSYNELLIATGARARTLPVLDGYENVSTLRTVEDCARLRTVLTARSSLGVLGAGFIGQEVAATARRSGCRVTMIEAAPVPLAGILGERMGAWFADLHRAEGVFLRASSTVTGATGAATVSALQLSDGTSVSVDHVVVGVGVEPEVSWLRSSGLPAIASGVRVDARARTPAEHVWAAGDAAVTFDPRTRRHRPGGHWEVAARQGIRAAHGMLGLEPPREPLPSFWTDQYGIRIQYLGHAPSADAVTIDGEPGRRSFIATYTRAGQAVAALLVNRPRALPQARHAIEKGAGGL